MLNAADNEKWIPVTKRLPEDYVIVLVSGRVNGLAATNMAFCKDRKWYRTFDWKEWKVDIEAWMPLPEPYEKDL